MDQHLLSLCGTYLFFLMFYVFKLMITVHNFFQSCDHYSNNSSSLWLSLFYFKFRVFITSMSGLVVSCRVAHVKTESILNLLSRLQ